MLFTDPARGEVDMVFQFEHVQLDQGGVEVGHAPARLRDLKALFGRWQAGWPSAAGTASTGTTTTSRGSSPASATTASTASVGQDARHGAAPAPRDAVRLPGRGARHDELPVRLDRATSATSSRSTTTRRSRRGADPSDVLAALRDDAAGTTRARRCSGTPRRTPASPPARRGSPSTRTTPRSTRRPQRADPDSVLPPLPAADRAAPQPSRPSRTATSRCCCRTTSASTRSPAGYDDDRAARARQLLRRAGAGRPDRAGRTPSC